MNIDPLVLIVKNSTGEIYISSLGINTIGNWEIQQGYKVKVSNSANLTIGCDQIDPITTPILLNTGWNLIAYLRSSAMDAVAH